MNNNSVKKSTIKKIMPYIKKYMVYVIMSLIFAAVSVALTLYIPKLTGKAIDLIVDRGFVDFHGVWNILLMIAVLSVVAAFSQWLMNTCNNKITYGVVKDIRDAAFVKIEKLPLKYIDTHPYGDTVSRVIADADQFADGLLMGFTQLFSGVITICATVGFMISINFKIAIIVVVLTPISIFVAKFIAGKTHDMFKLQSVTRGEQTALIDEMVGNQKVVQAYGQEQRVLERFDEVNERLSRYSLRAVFFSSLTNPSTRFVNNLVYAVIAIVGAILAINKGITVGDLTCLLNYANQYTKPFNEISGVITELQNSFVCAGRVMELIDEEPVEPDGADAIELTCADG